MDNKQNGLEEEGSFIVTRHGIVTWIHLISDQNQDHGRPGHPAESPQHLKTPESACVGHSYFPLDSPRSTRELITRITVTPHKNYALPCKL
jgi:hypothetical protein